MTRSKLRLAGLMSLAVGAALFGTMASTTTASSQGSYFGQQATQNRDYARQSSINSRMGKTNKVTLNTKKKKKAKKQKSAKKS